MTDVEIALLGRITALETVTLTFLAHLAAHTDDPQRFVAQVMANAEHLVGAGNVEGGPESEEARVQMAARQSFAGMTDHLLAHLTRYAAPQGRG